MKPCCEQNATKRVLHSNTIIGIIALLLVSFVFLRTPAFGQAPQTKADTAQSTPKAVKSPRLTADGTIGSAKISIDYSSPSVRGRTIWGGLVGYGTVWVTGGHNATTVEFSKDVKIGDRTVKAGIYALFTIPGTTDWTIILNTNYDQHLADDYDEKLDVVRIKATPKPLDAVQEALRYDVQETSKNEGLISVRWEKLVVSLPVKTR
jgi:hypothetical protein